MFPTITHSHNLLLEYARTLGTLGLLTVAVLIITIVVMLVTTVLGTMLYAPDRKSLRPLLIGLALSSGSYVLANMSSESFGPSTTPFFWLILFTFFAVRAETLKERGSARSRVLKQVRRVVRPSEINGPANV